MTTLDFTGVKPEAASAINSKLSDLLANYQVFYTNTRGFHWNIKGKAFFALHLKFEDLYNDIAAKIDEIAERILMLGGVPANNFSQYLTVSGIKEVSGISCEEKALNNILESLKIVLTKQREIKNLADSNGDDATSDLVSGYIAAQEKTIWMLVAYLQD